MAHGTTELSPAKSFNLRVDSIVLPHGGAKTRWFIMDGAVIIAEVRDLGPGTDAIARKLAASLDLLAALKNWQRFELPLEERQNAAIAAISKAERGVR